MKDPLKILKESIKHTPVMKYALAVAGLAAAASIVVAFSKDYGEGIKGMAIVVAFMVVLILVTNIPALASLQRFVSFFLTFILIVIVIWSGLYTYSYAVDLGIVRGIADAESHEIAIDVIDDDQNAIDSGKIEVRIPGSPAFPLSFDRGNAKVSTKQFLNKSGDVTLKVSAKGYQTKTRSLPIKTVLEDRVISITLEKVSNGSPPTTRNSKIVTEFDTLFCDETKRKILSGIKQLSNRTLDKYTFSSRTSTEIERHEDNPQRYIYQGGHLIVLVNGNTEVAFPSIKIESIDLRQGNPKAHVQESLNTKVSEKICAFSDQDIKLILNSL